MAALRVMDSQFIQGVQDLSKGKILFVWGWVFTIQHLLNTRRGLINRIRLDRTHTHWDAQWYSKCDY